MVDYYHILGVNRNASAREIKSAYRRLARQRHPDLNNGSEKAARDFALLALAYRTLADRRERASYDALRDAEHRRLREFGRRPYASVFQTDNPHARRMRVAAAQARYDRAIDLLLDQERRETMARAKAVFTTVTLFLSTFIVAMLKPRFWQNFDGYLGRTILLALFLVGLWHLASRLRESFELYTYSPKPIQASIMHGDEKPEQPFTRMTALSFLVIGYAASLGAGLFAGVHMYYVVSDLAVFFDRQLRPDLLFYPPIAVLIVDTMHAVASKID